MTDVPIPLPGEPLRAGKLQSFGQWFTWTPVLDVISGTPPTLGAGSSRVGQWHNNAGLVTVQADVYFGNSGVAAGSGIYRMTVPVALHSSWDPRIIVGDVAIWDATGPVQRGRCVRFVDATHVVFTAEDGTNVTNAVPMTWAANDHLHALFHYRGAEA